MLDKSEWMPKMSSLSMVLARMSFDSSTKLSIRVDSTYRIQLFWKSCFETQDGFRWALEASRLFSLLCYRHWLCYRHCVQWRSEVDANFPVCSADSNNVALRTPEKRARTMWLGDQVILFVATPWRFLGHWSAFGMALDGCGDRRISIKKACLLITRIKL